MNWYEMIIKLLVENKVPLYVRKDVLNRSFDWLDHGNETDDYMKRQYEYLKTFIWLWNEYNWGGFKDVKGVK